MRPVILLLVVLVAGCSAPAAHVSVSEGNTSIDAFVPEDAPTRVGNTTVYVSSDGREWTAADPPARPPEGERTSVIVVRVAPWGSGLFLGGVNVTLRNAGDVAATIARADVFQGTRGDIVLSPVGTVIAPGAETTVTLRAPGWVADAAADLVARVAFREAAEVRAGFSPRVAVRIEPLANLTWNERGVATLDVRVHNDGNFPVEVRDFTVKIDPEDRFGRAWLDDGVEVAAGGERVVRLGPISTGFPRGLNGTLHVALMRDPDNAAADATLRLLAPALDLADVVVRYEEGCTPELCALANVTLRVSNAGPTAVQLRLASARVGGATHEPWDSGVVALPGASVDLLAEFGFADLPPDATEIVLRIEAPDGTLAGEITAPLPARA